MPAPLELEALKALGEQGEIETVICAIPDHWGRLVGKRLPLQTFLKVALGDEGLHGSLFLLCVDMEMEPRDGYALTSWETGFPDFRFAPDLSTLCRIPWQEKTAMVICDVCEEDSDTLVEVAPRTILRRQIEQAGRLGLSIQCATELEFYLYHAGLDQAWADGYRSLRPTSRYRSDYHVFQGTLTEDFARDVREGMNAAGVEVEFSKPEWGLGQQEINTRYTDAMRMADRHIIFKTGIKELAVKHGLIATFMAKPFFEEVGSSCHVHLSLWDQAGETAMGYDEQAENGVSQTMAAFLAGSIATAKDFAPTLAPTINAYKRIQPESFAPTRLAWGLDNRTCSHRVIGHGASFRFENRIPGADLHPYTGLAGLIAGGLHGIESDMALPQPLAANAYATEGLEVFPRSLQQAIEHFVKSPIVSQRLGEAAKSHLLNFYRTECDDFIFATVTDWERMRYFERI